MVRVDWDLEIPVEESEMKMAGCWLSLNWVLRVRCVRSDVSVYNGPGGRW